MASIGAIFSDETRTHVRAHACVLAHVHIHAHMHIQKSTRIADAVPLAALCWLHRKYCVLWLSSQPTGMHVRRNKREGRRDSAVVSRVQICVVPPIHTIICLQCSMQHLCQHWVSFHTQHNLSSGYLLHGCGQLDGCMHVVFAAAGANIGCAVCVCVCVCA